MLRMSSGQDYLLTLTFRGHLQPQKMLAVLHILKNSYPKLYSTTGIIHVAVVCDKYVGGLISPYSSVGLFPISVFVHREIAGIFEG